MKETTIRIVKAENGFVVLSGSDLRSGDMWQRSWVASTPIELAKVIITNLVLTEIRGDANFEDELNNILNSVDD